MANIFYESGGVNYKGFGHGGWWGGQKSSENPKVLNELLNDFGWSLQNLAKLQKFRFWMGAENSEIKVCLFLSKVTCFGI